MPAESTPNQNPDLTPDIEAQAWELHDLRKRGLGAVAEELVPNHVTGGVDPLYVALAACPQARVAMDSNIEMGEMSKVAPLDAATFFVRKQQASMTPEQKEEAFLKSGQD